MPQQRRAPQLTNCAFCNQEFMQNKWWQKYCTKFCNQAAYYARATAPIDITAPPEDPLANMEAERERRKNELAKAPPAKKVTLTTAELKQIEDATALAELKILQGDKPTLSFEDLGYGAPKEGEK